jgi:hypothetical protein
MYKLVLFFFILLFHNSYSQVVEEIIPLDTSSIILKVIYRQPTEGYYFKKIAVYANDTNKVAIEKTFTSYAQNGLAKVYYPSGNIMTTAVYANNKINGDWTWYYENGIIKVKGQYKAGVKHGYWAYKYIKTYGRYKKEKKNGKWKRFDENGVKHYAYYKKGKFIRGENLFSEELNTFSPEQPTKNNVTPIDSNYQVVIHHLTKNYVFRKKFKYYFGKNKKERAALDKHFNYRKDYFKFRLAPIQIPLELTLFTDYLKQNNIENTAIDSILKSEAIQTTEAKRLTSNYYSWASDSALYEKSTDKTSEIIIYLSKVENNLVKVEIFKCVLPPEEINYQLFYKENKCKKFNILFYLNKEKKIVGIEYEKPQ